MATIGDRWHRNYSQFILVIQGIRKLADAREGERRLVAQNLHDTIGGRLAGLQQGMERVVREFHADSEKAVNSLRKLYLSRMPT